MSCTDSSKCQATLKKKLLDKFSVLISKPYESNWSLTCYHEKKAHWIIVSICDKDGKEDALRLEKEIADKNKSYDAILKGTRNKKNVLFGFTAKIETVDNPNMPKVKGKIPTQQNIMDAI
jgi:hypothetical protein